ncbi:MAG: hypothetical protein UT61_C0008G0033 [Candidatus Woesebacteria bacterium GW2011_GWA1_39_8]|uniref:Uncharacterized protein n=1 Tax=Candidatus Woesebacteria bacterium GW2011_GWA1_39_8 TaxID=1618552 RepID=A0A0G0SXP8_9BACT|nr:MAG: hypothetical protein UT61_C0008G0033 [Candidatus Woesebacteria bacterium GW2011_GWA1_39_8]
MTKNPTVRNNQIVNKNQKGFAHLFLVVVIVIIGLGFLIYYSLQKGLIKTIPSNKFSLTPTTSIDETADWKTYRSEKYGFEFKYPTDWLIILQTDFSFVVSNMDFDPALEGATPLPGQVFLKFYLTHASLENYSSVKKSYISTEGVEVIKQGRYIDPSESIGIISLYRADDPKKEKHEKIIDLIVSTFKFTNNDLQKEYKNEEVSFKYPSGWKQTSHRILGSKSILEVEGQEGLYSLTYTQQANYKMVLMDHIRLFRNMQVSPT